MEIYRTITWSLSIFTHRLWQWKIVSSLHAPRYRFDNLRLWERKPGVMPTLMSVSWWRHCMEILYVLLALCEAKSSVDSPHKGPVMWGFDVVVSPNKVLKKVVGDLTCNITAVLKSEIDAKVDVLEIKVPSILQAITLSTANRFSSRRTIRR